MGPWLRQVDGTTCGGPPGPVPWTVNSSPLRLSAREAVHVAYREVPVFEVREVLRLWLDGRGHRAIAGLVPPDRKTVTRVIETAVGLGLDRGGGVGQLDDGFVGSVMAAIRQDRPDRHGETWSVIVAHHDKIAGWEKKGDIPARKMVELLARSGTVVPERTMGPIVSEYYGGTEGGFLSAITGPE